METHPLRALSPPAGPRSGTRSPIRPRGAKKGAEGGEHVLKYLLDESGFSLCLPPTYSWTLKGRKHHHRVRTRWGKQGGASTFLGTLLCLEGEAERLEYRLVETSCRSGEVVGYLELLAEKATREGKPVVVVLDNAPFDKAGAVCKRRPGWEAKGLRLYYLPAYCPHLDPIEGVWWRRLQGFLISRRFYDSVAELGQAVLSALRLLGAIELQCELRGT